GTRRARAHPPPNCGAPDAAPPRATAPLRRAAADPAARRPTRPTARNAPPKSSETRAASWADPPSRPPSTPESGRGALPPPAPSPSPFSRSPSSPRPRRESLGDRHRAADPPSAHPPPRARATSRERAPDASRPLLGKRTPPRKPNGHFRRCARRVGGRRGDAAFDGGRFRFVERDEVRLNGLGLPVFGLVLCPSAAATTQVERGRDGVRVAVVEAQIRNRVARMRVRVRAERERAHPVVDRDAPLHRRLLALADGRDQTVCHDLRLLELRERNPGSALDLG